MVQVSLSTERAVRVKDTTTQQNGRNATKGILLVDPSRLVREALAEMLQDHGLTVVAAAGGCSEAAQECQRNRPKVVIAATQFLDGDLVDLAALIENVDPHIAILVLGEGAPGDVELAIKAGASGYLGAEARAFELIESVQKIMDGSLMLAGVGRAFVPTTREVRPRSSPLFSEPSYERISPPFGITSREQEILSFLCIGWSNREIARRLGISENTVRTHVQNIRVKLNVRSRMEAALVAMRVGIRSAEWPFARTDLARRSGFVARGGVSSHAG